MWNVQMWKREKHKNSCFYIRPLTSATGSQVSMWLRRYPVAKSEKENIQRSLSPGSEFYTDTYTLANPPPVKGKIPWQVGGPRRAMSSDAPRRLEELSQWEKWDKLVVTLAWIMFVEESPGGFLAQGPSRAQAAIFKKCCQGAQLARALPRVGAKVPERIW